MAIETWLLINHCFRLPLAVSWEGSQNIAKVVLHPGVPWLKPWKQAVADMLANIVFSEHEGAYFIFSQWLERLAVRVADTEDIENLIMWQPNRPPIGLPAGEMKHMGPQRTKRATEIREFLQWFVDSSGIKLFERIEELESFYYMLMGSGLLYMLETGKAMPLTWGRVFATPTRTGWQKDTFKGIKGCRLKLPPNERIAQRVYAGQSRMMDKQSKLEQLHPEVIADEGWRQTVLAHEKNYHANHTDAAYVRMCRDRIKKTIPLLLDAFTAYKKEAAHSTWSDVRPDVEIVPGTGKMFRRHRTSEQVAEDKRQWALRLQGADRKRQRIIKSPLEKQNVDLSALRAVFEGGADVWLGEGDVQESGHKP